MVDLSGVRGKLVALATSACYPNGTSSASITTRQITIGPGWPEPRDVDTAMSASWSVVTVYAIPGATAKEEQFFEPQQVITSPIFGMAAVVAPPATATITGPPASGEYLTFIVDGIHSYSTTAGASDTNITMAAAIAGLAAVGYPGTISVAGVVTVVGAHDLVVRIGAPYTVGQLLHRQRQQFRVTVFATTDSDRTAIGTAIDLLFKDNIRLVFPDKSEGIMHYLNVLEDDTSERFGNYRRGLVYDVSYGTFKTYTAYSITSITVRMTDEITGNIQTNVH